MYRYIASIALLLLHIANAVFANDRQPATSVVVASPDQQVAIEVFLEEAGNDRSRACYRVSFHDKVAVLPSRLGVELADDTTLGGDCAVEKVERRSFDETYNQFPGKRSRVRDRGVEAVISFRENTMPKRRWQLVARAYDDGVAFRYRFAKQKDGEKLELDNRLTVTIHNTKEPTGLERTYPNLLTAEGVRNLEFDKWDAAGISPTDDLMVPYTRMLAGPLDYHQGTLRGVPVAKFQARNAAPLVIGTPCHALASYVVYQNHLPMLADYPSAYRGHPALPFLVNCPVSWDDTRCLAGEPGEYVIVARRSGSNWYLGAMSGVQTRELDLPLRFLAASRYRAEIFADDLEGTSRFRLVERVQEVTSADSLRIQLDTAGGYAAKLTLSLGHEPDRIRGIPIQE